MVSDFAKILDGPLSFIKDKRLLIAVSGGVDSVVLSWLCYHLHLNFGLAHCNFNLRDAESDLDEEFVIELADQLNVEVFVQGFDTAAYAEAHKTSIQMAARELRYDWLHDLADQLNFDYILTAHHADDDLETFLINFTRGTGLNGLIGIPVVNEKVIRPLLSFSREEIMAYARHQGITWREDSSNATRKYLRNKLRHEVVPVLKEINPQLLNSFQATLHNLQDAADIIDESLNAVAKRAITSISDNGITYKISEFKKVNNPRAYLYEMFKDFGFTAWNDVLHLLDAETGKYVYSNTHKLQKFREFLILSELESTDDAPSCLRFPCKPGAYATPIGTICISEAYVAGDNSDRSIFIDGDAVDHDFECRLWQKEDILYPLGMTGTKKMSKFLKDERLSPLEKARTWILATSDAVVWVIGKRADERFKVTTQTKRVFRIELKT